MPETMDLNNVKLCGIMKEGPECVSKGSNPAQYNIVLATARKSGVEDLIHVALPASVLNGVILKVGYCYEIEGRYISEFDKNQINYLVEATNISLADAAAQHIDLIDVEGRIFKEPRPRKTGFGHDITDIRIQSRHLNRTSLLVGVCWNDVALFAQHLSCGGHVILHGRIQSREYEKEGIVHTVSELAVRWIEVVE